MKTLKLSALLIALFVGSLFAQSYQPVTKFDPTRDAAKDLELALAEASRTNKRVLLDVGGVWCIWCKRLDEFIESNSTVKAAFERNFVILKVNYSKENKNEAVLSKYPKIPGYPHFFVLDKSGNLIQSHSTGDLEKGKTYDEAKMLEFVTKWGVGK